MPLPHAEVKTHSWFSRLPKVPVAGAVVCLALLAAGASHPDGFAGMALGLISWVAYNLEVAVYSVFTSPLRWEDANFNFLVSNGMLVLFMAAATLGFLHFKVRRRMCSFA